MGEREKMIDGWITRRLGGKERANIQLERGATTMKKLDAVNLSRGVSYHWCLGDEEMPHHQT